MTAVRMAVFDLDGTLLEHGSLTREARRMLRALRQQGITVVIATGRHRGTVPLRLKSPRLVDYLICSNGAVVTPTKGEPLLEKTLSAHEVRALMALGDEYGCRYSVNIGSATFLSRQAPLKRPKTDWLSDTKKFFWRYYMYPLHSRTVDSWGDYLLRPDAGAEKVICIPAREAAERDFRAQAEADGRFTVSGSNRMTEITARGVSKGTALQALTERLRIPKEAVVAFGNDDNDLSMGACAGRFVAARASSPAALAAADQVADSIPAAALGLCISEEGKEAKGV